MARVLVCDDADDVRLVVGMALEMAGHTVTQVEGGSQAIAHLDQHPDVDLLVLDVQMPDVDGWTVLQHVRAHPVVGDLRVMMCTVKSDLADLLRAWELGCDAYVVKPFDLSTLTETVTAVLARSDDDRLRWREDRLRQLRDLGPSSWRPDQP